MNTSVDVLEVMRKSANVASMNALDHGGNVLMNFADDCEAARAAVAELIDVASQFDSYLSSDFGDTSILDNEDLWSRLSNALSRVRGGE